MYIPRLRFDTQEGSRPGLFDGWDSSSRANRFSQSAAGSQAASCAMQGGSQVTGEMLTEGQAQGQREVWSGTGTR